MLTFEHIAELSKGKWLSHPGDQHLVKSLVTDSRKMIQPLGEALFFAIKGDRHNGHDFIQSLYKRGVRMFVVTEEVQVPSDDACVLLVQNSVNTLQIAAAEHRSQYDLDVIGITGSNGKTIVKEWLSQLLAPYGTIVKSPGSYNSQIGVPLSVWQIREDHEIGIFEAGISKHGEMESLQKIIRPNIGIFTNIGSAHDEGFSSQSEKIAEKMKLFADCDILIYCRDYDSIQRQVTCPAFHWGRHPESHIRIESQKINHGTMNLHLTYDGSSVEIDLPFSDPASVENAMHAVAYMVYAGFSWEEIQKEIRQLQPMRMRLEMKRAINGSYLIDDTYNNDLGGLEIALDFLTSQPGANKKTLIISDVLQTGLPADDWIKNVMDLAGAADIQRVVAVGPEWYGAGREDVIAYPTTDELILHLNELDFEKEFILVKGARSFQMEKVVLMLEEKIHGTVLEVDLNALTNNLNFYRSRLSHDVKVMVMVKAFAYGSGSVEIANLLQYHRVNYLGVAYADEGVHLRRNGIKVPIMVMNPSLESIDLMLSYDLEPEIYNFRILKNLIQDLRGRKCRIHIKLDTGMHRLGFEEEDVPKLQKILIEYPEIEIASIFSHLAGADTSEHREFTHQQASRFEKMSAVLCADLRPQPLRHLLNSPGIINYPEYQYDMVRLGIGLYGIDASHQEQDQLSPISRLRTVISQIKHVKKGESIGYDRKGRAQSERIIATIAIGYADGFSRSFSNGEGKVWVNGSRAPVIGNVCMDMTMIDITGISASEGDEVEIFGSNISISEMAETIDTIPYEILTNVSQRVRRVFISE